MLHPPKRFPLGNLISNVQVDVLAGPVQIFVIWVDQWNQLDCGCCSSGCCCCCCCYSYCDCFYCCCCCYSYCDCFYCCVIIVVGHRIVMYIYIYLNILIYLQGINTMVVSRIFYFRSTWTGSLLSKTSWNNENQTRWKCDYHVAWTPMSCSIYFLHLQTEWIFTPVICSLNFEPVLGFSSNNSQLERTVRNMLRFKSC